MKQTSNLLMLKREVDFPVDWIYASPPSQCTPNSVDDHVKYLEKKLKYAHNVARQEMLKAELKQK